MRHMDHETKHGHEALGFLQAAVDRADRDETVIENVSVHIDYSVKD